MQAWHLHVIHHAGFFMVRAVKPLHICIFVNIYIKKDRASVRSRREGEQRLANRLYIRFTGRNIRYCLAHDRKCL